MTIKIYRNRIEVVTMGGCRPCRIVKSVVEANEYDVTFVDRESERGIALIKQYVITHFPAMIDSNPLHLEVGVTEFVDNSKDILAYINNVNSEEYADFWYV